MEDEMRAAEFADACAYAAVRLRVLGHDGRRRPSSEWRRFFFGELSAALAKRAAAPGRTAVPRQSKVLGGNSTARHHRGSSS